MDYDRRTAASYANSENGFNSTWNLWMYLTNEDRSWGKGAKDRHGGTGGVTFSKRFGSVWIELSFNKDSHWETSVYLTPKRFPQVSSEGRDELLRSFIVKVPFSKSTALADIERAAADLARQVREHAAAPAPKDYSHYYYRPRNPKIQGDLEGTEALAEWKLEVTAILLQEINGAAEMGQACTTRNLIQDVLNNHNRHLGGASRSEEARMITAILKSLAAKGKILRSSGGDQVEWEGLNFKSKRRW
jgi:hypothetical protein